ncbi:MAG TPA: 3-hydroxyacyl-CoA dehydrogenase [Paraburkholderia sp.]|nr:3-hydroxyacyl-CoA dehydrogenase [Paraburkholderia sp.]
MSESVAVIGAGRIGCAWAIVFARAGLAVRLHDADPAALDAALPQLRNSVDDLKEFGLLDESPADVVARITTVAALAEAVDGVTLVQENIAEVVNAKRAMYAELDRLAPADALLASSTSGLPASSFTEGLAGRARCLVAHPVNPPSLVPLVELCGAPWTSDETMQRARAFYTGVGQTAVLVRREISGFLLNRLQGALLGEAMNLYARGYASAADLDSVMRDGLGMRWSFMGPFETIDLNAPGGVTDYCARYGGTYRAIAAESEPFDWSPETIAALDAERREALPVTQIEERSRWRDRQLMALLAHRKRTSEL